MTDMLFHTGTLIIADKKRFSFTLLYAIIIHYTCLFFVERVTAYTLLVAVCASNNVSLSLKLET